MKPDYDNGYYNQDIKRIAEFANKNGFSFIPATFTNSCYLVCGKTKYRFSDHEPKIRESNTIYCDYSNLESLFDSILGVEPEALKVGDKIECAFGICTVKELTESVIIVKNEAGTERRCFTKYFSGYKILNHD